MGTGDGTVVGTTQIVNNGPPTARWNLVIMGDGYQSAQLGQFANDVQSFVNILFATPPFDTLRRAVNVYRVDVSSTDSGAADPTACGGTGAVPRTYFDASFCHNGIRRLLEVNTTTALAVAGAQVPQWNMVMVIVNSTVYGGSGGGVATFSLDPSANEIGLHEMGHTAFNFADEYESYAGCGVDPPGTHDHHPAVEPMQPNVTIDANGATNKWRDLVLSTTPMPTTTNADCSQCDPQPNPVSADTVGAFEGADYYHCGAYRPQFTCRMRALGNPYCAVCQRTIRTTLAPHMPAAAGSGGRMAARSRIPNSMEVWWVGADGSIQDSFWYDGATWQRFTLAPAGSAALGSRVAAVSRIPNSMELWWVRADGSIQDAFWYDGATWQQFTLAPAGSAS